MKLAIVCTICRDFGAKGFYNTQEIGLGRALAALGHEVSIYKCLQKKTQKKLEVLHPEPNLTVCYVPVIGIGMHGWFNTSLLPKGLDGVFCFSDHQIFIPHIERFCRRNDIAFLPYVGVLHSTHGGLHYKLVDTAFSAGTLKMYRRRFVLAKTEGAKQQLGELGVSNVRVAPVGLDFSVLNSDFKSSSKPELKARYGYKESDTVILNVARLKPEKRTLELLDIFARIHSKKNFKLILVGEGPMRGEIDAKIEALGIGGLVRIYDRVPYEKMWELYRISDYYVNLNKKEIFGMAIMEAVYYEVAAAAISAPGPCTTLAGMRGHRICENDEQLENFLLDSYPSRDELEYSAKKLKHDFGWERCAKEFINFTARYHADKNSYPPPHEVRNIESEGDIMDKFKELKICMLGQKRVPSREGGVEVVVEELATRMVELGHSVTCYNRGGQHISGREYNEKRGKEYKGIRLKTVLTIDKRGIAAMTSSVSASICAAFGRYDVVHYHSEGPCAMLWLPKLFGKRFVATVHGLDWDREKWRGSFASKYIKFGEKVAVKYADEIIVLSKNNQQYFMDTYGRETRFVCNGVNRPHLRPADEIKKRWGLEKDGYILFVGRLVPEKGLHYLIDAFRELKTDKKLVIAGSSSNTEAYVLESKARAAGDERIIFTGFITKELLDEVYSNAYVYVLPSDLEGMPLSLLEAMSYGNCCIVSDICECTEVVEDKAIVFEKGNVQDLRTKLRECLDYPSMVQGYKDCAADYICQKYNWDDVVKRTLELYAK